MRNDSPFADTTSVGANNCSQLRALGGGGSSPTTPDIDIENLSRVL